MTSHPTKFLLFGILLIIFSQTHILTTFLGWFFFSSENHFTVNSVQLNATLVEPLDGILGIAGLVVGSLGFFRKQAE